MKILLTGFEPFGPVQVNPSEQIVRRIREETKEVAEGSKEESKTRGTGDLRAEVLPTEFIAADRRIRQLIREFRPDAVLCLGVAPQRDKISLERFALNMDDDVLPDNAGRSRTGRPIAPNGPAAYWSTLPLERFERQLKRRGIPVVYSNHAGTYLCNHVFYVVRHLLEQLGSSAPCGFVHLPPLRTRGGKARGLPLDTMVEAVECCLSVLRKK